MSCTLSQERYLELRDKVVNQKAINTEIPSDYKQIENWFDEANALIYPKGEKGYAFLSRLGQETDEIALPLRVSRLADQAYANFKRGMQTSSPSARQKALAEGGTAIHYGFEVLNNILYNKYLKGQKLEFTDAEIVSVRDEINKKGFDKFGINTDYIKILSATTKRLFNEAKKTQDSIDPKQKFIMRSEQTVLSPQTKEAGTADLLFVYSDKSASQFDYKTAQINQNFAVGVGANATLISEPIRDVKKQGYGNVLFRRNQILQENYGITKFRHTEIVPILVNYDKNNKLNRVSSYDSVTDDTQKNFLVNQAVVFTKEEDISLTDSINKKLRLIDLYKQIRKEAGKQGNDAKWQDYNMRIAATERLINRLIVDRDNKILMKELLEVIKRVEDTVKNHLPVTDENNDNYLNLSDVLSLYNEIKVIRETYFIDVQEAEEKMSAEAKTDEEKKKVSATKIALYSRIKQLDVSLSIVEEHIMSRAAELYDKYEANPNAPIEQLGYIDSMFRRMSDYENPIFKATSLAIQLAERRKKIKFEKWYKELDETIEKLKKSGMSLSEAHKALINPKTGMLYGKYDKENFWDIVNKAFENKDIKTIKQFYKLKEGALDDYKIRKQRQEQLLKSRHRPIIENGVVIFSQQEADRQYNKAMEFWENQNNPNKSEAWLGPNRFRFLEVNNAEVVKNQKYLSNGYKNIFNNKNLLAYYNFLQESNAMFRDMLGMTTKEMPDNFIAWIRKDMVETWTHNTSMSFIDKLNITGKNFKRNFTVAEDETMFGELDPNTGRPLNKIPVFWITPIFKTDEKGESVYSLEDKSFDLARSFTMFAEMAFNYAEKSKVEPEIDLLKQVLLLSDLPLKKSGKEVLNTLKTQVLKRFAPEDNIVATYEELVEGLLYGKSIKEIDKGQKYNAEIGKVNVEKVLLKLNSWYVQNRLGLNPYVALASYLAPATFMRAQGKKGTLFNTQQVNKATAMMAKWQMNKVSNAFDKDAKAISFIMDFFQTYTEDNFARDAKLKSRQGIVGKAINTDNLFKFLQTAESAMDLYITTAMAQNYGYTKDGKFVRIFNEDGSKRQQYKDVKSIFEVSNEAIQKGKNPYEELTDLQALRFRRAVQEASKMIKGTMTYDDKARWQQHLAFKLVMTFKSWMPGVLSERFGQLKYNEKIDNVTWGRYKSAVATNFLNEEGKFTLKFLKLAILPALGRGIRNLVIAGHIFGRKGEKLVKGMQIIDEAKALRYYERWKEENPEAAKNVSFEDFVRVVENNALASVVELRILLGFAAMLFALGMKGDDDDEPMWKTNFATRSMYRTLNRVNSELTFSYSSNEVVRILKNPIPILGWLTLTNKLLENTADELGDLIYGNVKRDGFAGFLFGENKGLEKQDKTPALHYSSQYVTGLATLMRIFELMEGSEEAER